MLHAEACVLNNSYQVRMWAYDNGGRGVISLLDVHYRKMGLVMVEEELNR